ncbi:hypothetical protein ACA910_004593 [Epithemia clementina (nom. ined.)]
MSGRKNLPRVSDLDTGSKSEEFKAGDQIPSSPYEESVRIKVDGVSIELADDDVATEVQGPLYRKEICEALSPEKKNDLFSQAVKQSQTKYDFMSLDFSDEKRLDELYNMSIMISKTKAAHLQYDMCDVFKIVFPALPGCRELSDRTPVDLYTHYDEVTEEEVAQSCEWYRKYTKKNYYRENLLLTFRHLENNMTHRLFDKTFERYESYPELQAGGPLLFAIMMKHLVSNSEEAISHLKKMIKDMKISKFTGEDVSRVVSLLRGAHKHLRFLKKVPEDFGSQILAILQTSSVAEFNEYFAHYRKTLRMMKDVSQVNCMEFDESEQFGVDMILKLAEGKYKDLVASGEWTGIKTKGKASAFTGSTTPQSNNNNNSGTKKHKCWNCGGDHLLPKCTKPRDQERINANKAKFDQSKQASNVHTATPPPERKTDGKFRPPQQPQGYRRQTNVLQ